MEEMSYDKGYEQGYAEAMEVVRKTKITPTKEQIIKIMDNTPKEFDGVFWCDGLSSFIFFVVTEWEKIRNSPK